MRLVSQDGTVDVPYDISAISLGEHGVSHVIYVSSKLLDDKPCAFADYSSEAKALKAMEMLQKQFLDYSCNYHAKSGVFYFPKDEEIEV